MARSIAAMMRRNVEAADATIVFTGDRLTPGSRKTMGIAEAAGRPILHVRMAEAARDCDGTRDRIRAWLGSHEVEVLDVAGSRESRCPGLQRFVEDLIASLSTRRGRE